MDLYSFCSATEMGFPTRTLITRSIVIGAGLGIGKIGGSAMDAIARQPEASGKIQTAMLIAAALIEGIGFAALFAA